MVESTTCGIAKRGRAHREKATSSMEHLPSSVRRIFLPLVMGALVCAAAFLAILYPAQSAYAAIHPTTVMANGVDMIANPGTETDPIRYDAATNTLTLENATINKPCEITVDGDTRLYGVYADGDLAIRLLGSSTLAFPAYNDNDATTWVTGVGLESQDDHDPYVGSISGGGTLMTQNHMMRGVSCDGSLTVQGSGLAIQSHFECLVSDGTMDIIGSSLSCSMDYGTDDPVKGGRAIYQLNDAALNITASNVSVEAPGGLSVAILSWGPIVIDSSTVRASADNTALYAGKDNGNITIKDSAIEATSATTTAIKADDGMSFTGETTATATAGNTYQPSAALYAYGTIAFNLTGTGSVHASVPADVVGRHDSDSAIHAAGYLSKDDDGRITLADGNALIDPAGAVVTTYRDEVLDVNSAYIAQADGADAHSVTIAVAQEVCLLVEPDALSFSATVGYDDITAQPVTLTNAGDVALHVSAQQATLFDTDLPANTVLAPGQTLVVNIQPVHGIAEGSHAEAVTFIATEGSQAAVTASLNVTPAPQPKPQPTPPNPHRGNLAPTGDANSAILAVLLGVGTAAFALVLLARKRHTNRK